MAIGAYNPYGTSYAQRQKIAQQTYPNQTPAAPTLQSSPNTYGTNYSSSSNYFTPKDYNLRANDSAYTYGGYQGWGSTTDPKTWDYSNFSNRQKEYLARLQAFNTNVSNDYANWMNGVNSAENYGNTVNNMSYSLNPQRQYQQNLMYNQYLDSLTQNQLNTASRGLGYTGLAAGLDQRANSAYSTNLLNIESELNKMAIEQALSSIANQNTTGKNWLDSMLMQYSGGLSQLDSQAKLFGEGAGQASDYDKMMQQLALERYKADLNAQIEREKMAAEAAARASFSSGGGRGYGGYSSGGGSGYSSGATSGSTSAKSSGGSSSGYTLPLGVSYNTGTGKISINTATTTPSKKNLGYIPVGPVKR